MSLTLINDIDNRHANVTVAFSFDASRCDIDLESGNAATARPALTAWAERRRVAAAKSAPRRRGSVSRQTAFI